VIDSDWYANGMASENFPARDNSKTLLLSAAASSCCAIVGVPAKEITISVDARMKPMRLAGFMNSLPHNAFASIASRLSTSVLHLISLPLLR
jgi:hypothetical protein